VVLLGEEVDEAMRRREFIISLNVAALAYTASTVHAQQKAMPVIGYLSVGSPETDNIPERPYWVTDIKIGFSTFNARAEEIDTKPAFREAFRQQRCLVPWDNFYEWQKTATGKQPYAIGIKGRRADGNGRIVGDLALAGGKNASAASRSPPQCRTNCVPSFTTGCPWC
jgi:hypothetical protein